MKSKGGWVSVCNVDNEANKECTSEMECMAASEPPGVLFGRLPPHDWWGADSPKYPRLKGIRWCGVLTHQNHALFVLFQEHSDGEGERSDSEYDE